MTSPTRSTQSLTQEDIYAKSQELAPSAPGIIPFIDEEIQNLEVESAKYQSGEQDNAQFTPFRLKQGVYGQRQADVQMIRVKIPGGILTAEGLEVLGTITEDITVPFPPSFLEVRRGPDVVAASPQNDPISLQNVFVLIAPGKNRNASAGRSYVRDSNHVADSAGTPWALDTPLVDSVIFSATPNVDSTDSGNGGDDTLLWISFTNYKAMVSKYGLNMEPLCDGPC